MPYRAMEVPRLPACQQRLCSAGSSGRGKPLCGTAPLDLVPRTTLALLSLTLPTWSVAHMHPAHRDTRLLPCRALLHCACQGLAAGLLCPNTQVSSEGVQQQQLQQQVPGNQLLAVCSLAWPRFLHHLLGDISNSCGKFARLCPMPLPARRTVLCPGIKNSPAGPSPWQLAHPHHGKMDTSLGNH